MTEPKTALAGTTHEIFFAIFVTTIVAAIAERTPSRPSGYGTCQSSLKLESVARKARGIGCEEESGSQSR